MAQLIEWISPTKLGRSFRWLLGSTWIANLGDGLSIAAGPLLIASLTRNPFLVSLAAFMQWLPVFIFGLYSGAIADRVDRHRLILITNWLRAVTLATLTSTMFLHIVTVPIVLMALFAIGTADTFAHNAYGAVVPLVVQKSDLGLANSRINFGWTGLSQLAGPPLGAALFGIGMAWPFAAQTICAVTAVLLFAKVVVPPTPTEERERQHIWHDIREGLTWTRHSPAMLALVIQILTFNITFGASWSVLVLFSQERLGMGNIGFGVLSAVAAVGGLLGNATYPWLERHVSLANIMRYGLVLETVTHLIFAITTSPIVAMIIMFFFGIHEANWATTAMSVRQRAVPNELLGRVGGVYQVAMMGGLVVGSLIGGLLATHFGLLAPYWFGFIGCAIMLIAIWRRLGDIAHQDAQTLADDSPAAQDP